MQYSYNQEYLQPKADGNAGNTLLRLILIVFNIIFFEFDAFVLLLLSLFVFSCDLDGVKWSNKIRIQTCKLTGHADKEIRK